MSQIYYNWFLMCYNNEPPTVTEAQLQTALERGMLTQAEYDQIIESKQPEEIIVDPAPEEEVIVTDPAPEDETGTTAP
jgi:hypothetical protein